MAARKPKKSEHTNGDASLLKGIVRQGMFKAERVVIVSRPDGETESFFVPKSAVNEIKSAVRVHVRETANPPGSLVASLLTEDGQAYVTVRPSDIEHG